MVGDNKSRSESSPAFKCFYRNSEYFSPFWVKKQQVRNKTGKLNLGQIIKFL